MTDRIIIALEPGTNKLFLTHCADRVSRDDKLYLGQLAKEGCTILSVPQAVSRTLNMDESVDVGRLLAAIG